MILYKSLFEHMNIYLSWRTWRLYFQVRISCFHFFYIPHLLRYRVKRSRLFKCAFWKLSWVWKITPMYWKTENQYLNQIILVFTHIEYFLSREKWTGGRRICYFWGSTTSDSKGLFSYFKENENKLGAHPQYFSKMFSPMLIITVKSRCPEPFGQQNIWKKPNENHTKMWKPS